MPQLPELSVQPALLRVPIQAIKKALVTAMIILRRELRMMLRRQIMMPIVRQIPIIILLPIISKSLRMNVLAARMITVLPIIIHRREQARSF